MRFFLAEPSRSRLAALASLFVLAGCATDSLVDRAREQMIAGRGEEALLMLQTASQQAPGDHVLRNEYFRQRELVTAQWLAQAEALRLAGQFEAAEDLYRRILKHDASNARATGGLRQAATDRRHRAVLATAERLVKEEKFLDAQDALRPVLAENPQQREARRLQRLIENKTVKPALVTPRLKPSTSKPISIELRDVTLRAMFDIISRASGISFVFDKDVRGDQKVTFSVRDAKIEDLIRLLMAANQLEQKIINDVTVLVYPNTPAKAREYQELVVKSFYLSNADVKQTANMIRTVLKARDVFIDEKLNMLVLRDTPNAVRLAERLIAAQDLAEPEAMLEVEVLEIGSSKLLELGLRFPDSIAWSLVGAAGTPGTVSLPEWLSRNSSLVQLTFTNPLFLLNLRQQDGTSSVLANPRIRVKSREKARVHIGDRVPVITTTAAATGGFVSESVSYLDVGLKLEVEPLIYLEDEVGIKIGLEVSNIVREVRGSTTSTLTYQIGTRNANTVLRLRDGETQILAGLISDEDRRSASRVPGIGQLPVVGRLFSSTRDTAAKTEIVLLITPRLVRTLARPEGRATEFAAGTELSSGAASLTALQPGAPPAAISAPPAPPPAVTPAQPVPPAPQPTAPSSTAPTMVPFGGVQQPSTNP